MKRFLSLSFLFCMLAINVNANANDFLQNIKGQVIDKQSQQPLPGANVMIVGSNPVVGGATDINGYFKLTGIPVGRATVSISFLGYETATISNINVTSGKEIVLNIELEEKVTTTEEVVVKASKPKARASNDMATVSARSFTVEETERYAGSRGDIARMASNYAGVSFANDSRNDIVIRGNSPSGVLWKLEDVEIPNPNHFAENGTTGGPVGMLNNNVLKNSDFFTGAFPAEYANATSGVFDLKMRNGNTDKYEFTGQCGFNGFEIGAEGPIRKANNSSFLAFYRYSTLDLMDKLGFNFGTSGVPKYQDLSFKTNYPTKKGVISVFGIAGKSQISMLDSKLDEAKPNMYIGSGQDLYNRSSMLASGVTYTHFLNSKTYIKTSLSGLAQNGGTNIDTLERFERYKTITKADGTSTIDTLIYYQNPTRFLEHNISEYRLSLNTTVGTKYNASLSTKLGLGVDQMAYDLNSKIYTKINGLGSLFPYLNASKSLIEGPQLIKSYYEVSYKFTDNFSFNPGLSFIYLTLNNKSALEPRAGLTWDYSEGKHLNFGYGLHSKTHPLSVYYYIDTDDATKTETNKNLDFTKAHHFVLSHDWNINQDFRFKSEVYYQSLFNVPVEINPSNFSILNSGAGWGVQAPDSLNNAGKGYNYGCEFTLEKFLSKNYYFLLTTSLFESKYRGSDKKWHNTAFNGNYVVNALVGYEYPINDKWALAFDVKTAVAGGKRYTPLDLASSIAAKDAKYYENQAYEKQFPMFFKMDVKLGIRNNNKYFSQEWQIYVENVTNHTNLLYESFNSITLETSKVNQLGFFPMMNYRINF